MCADRLCMFDAVWCASVCLCGLIIVLLACITFCLRVCPSLCVCVSQIHLFKYKLYFAYINKHNTQPQEIEGFFFFIILLNVRIDVKFSIYKIDVWNTFLHTPQARTCICVLYLRVLNEHLYVLSLPYKQQINYYKSNRL